MDVCMLQDISKTAQRISMKFVVDVHYGLEEDIGYYFCFKAIMRQD